MDLMNQGWTYRDRITAQSAGQSVLAYYTHRYQHSSAAQWQARIEQGQIVLNEQPTSPDTVLQANQTLLYHRLPWAEPKVPLGFEVLYEDEAFWAIAKPSGLPVLPGGKFLQHTLLHQLKQRYPNQHPVPLHRLGRGTSGVMLIAKSQRARGILSAQFRQRSLTKTYRTLIGPAPALPTHFTCTDFIGKVPYPRLGYLYARVAPAHPSAKAARSDGEILQRRADATLLQVSITTGRPHQIRIHMAAQGYPLLGDPLYKAGGIPRTLLDDVTDSSADGTADDVTDSSADGTADGVINSSPDGVTDAIPSDCGYHLHAHRIRLVHPHNGKTLCIEAPLPECLEVSD
ncbi:MAG: RluA family pseudouridine synthase [Phormidesmis sp.]